MREVPHTNTEQNHDLVCKQNECKQGMNPAKIHAKPASYKSFANQWCQMSTWHGVWRHRETSYRWIVNCSMCFRSDHSLSVTRSPVMSLSGHVESLMWLYVEIYYVYVASKPRYITPLALSHNYDCFSQIRTGLGVPQFDTFHFSEHGAYCMKCTSCAKRAAARMENEPVTAVSLDWTPHARTNESAITRHISIEHRDLFT